MDDITELQRRIATALDRIDAGLLARDAEAVADGASAPADADELERIQAELVAEREVSAQLERRLQADRTRSDSDTAGPSERVQQLERHIVALEEEADRLRTANVALMESNRTLLDEKHGDASDALQGELDALRQVRASDRAELDALLALLAPIVERFGTKETGNA